MSTAWPGGVFFVGVSSKEVPSAEEGCDASPVRSSVRGGASSLATVGKIGTDAFPRRMLSVTVAGRWPTGAKAHPPIRHFLADSVARE